MTEEPQKLEISLDALNQQWAGRYAQLLTELTLTRQAFDLVQQQGASGEGPLIPDLVSPEGDASDE